jgi:CHAT domain-containing protein
MARHWVGLVGVAPLLLGIMAAVPPMVVTPLVLAQSQNQLDNLLRQGATQFRRGQMTAALTTFQQALALARQTKDRRGEATILNNIGLIYNSVGQPQRALEFYQQALPIIREVNDRTGEAITLSNIGLVYNNIGQPQRALEFYQQALPITREVNNRLGEASTLTGIGFVYNNIGQPQRALEFYQQALLIIREVNDRTGEAVILNNIGGVYDSIGQPQRALDFYQQALPIRREIGDRAGEATTLNNIGGLYDSIGQPQRALDFYQQALPIMREVGDRSGEATTLNNIGLVYDSIDQPQRALEFYQQALPIMREVNNRSGEAGVLNNIGLVYDSIDQPQRALEFFQQALPITREINDRSGEATTLNNIGTTYNGTSQSQIALEFFQQVLFIMREIGNRSGEARTLNNLALVQQALNELPTALQNIQAAIAIVEDIRGQLIDPDSRTSYFATVQNYYKLQIDLLMQLHTSNPNQGYAAQAFNVTERSKARTLLELLAESQADLRTGVDPQLLQIEQDIQTQLGAIDKRRIELANSTANNSQQITALETQRQALQNQYRDLQSQIRATSPKYAALKYPQPLTLEQIQQQILDDNTVILAYSLGEERSYLWLVSKTEMTSYQLPSRKSIEDLVNKKVRPQLTNPRTNRFSFLENTAALSNILLSPVLDKTRTEQVQSIGNKRLVIISDGALQYVPFGALPDPRAENNRYQPLLVNNEVVYLPSASTLQTLRNEAQARNPAPRTLAVLADPVFAADDQRVTQRSTPARTNELPLFAQNVDRAARDTRGAWNRLPGTRQEANMILNLVPASDRLAYFDFQANRDNALSDQLSQYRFIHWATHGFANAQKPELSGIVMSLVQENGQQQDGYLLLGDIFNLNFNADLVVLSACQTGLGEVVQGEGLIGLTRGLMYAGTTRVVTSLWEVPDTETASLMSKFYSKMLQENLRPAEALRAAQLEMFNSRNWVAPYYWAAFTLQGEWR